MLPDSPAPRPVDRDRIDDDDSSWTVEVGGGGGSLIVHVPHAGTWIPAPERRDILLDDSELAVELALMTDWYTDKLAIDALSTAGLGGTVFINRASRLLVDPERFPDDREVMATVGMGAVYTSTSHGLPLRRADPAVERRLLDRWFHPYAAAFTHLVDDSVAEHGQATVVDLHSFPSAPLPYELNQTAPRPGICIGTDPFHTPPGLLSAAHHGFAGIRGGTGVNTPFAGSYVPLRHLGKTAQVSSIMVEIRRDLYQKEPGGPISAGWVPLVTALAAFLASAANAEA